MTGRGHIERTAITERENHFGSWLMLAREYPLVGKKTDSCYQSARGSGRGTCEVYGLEEVMATSRRTREQEQFMFYALY